jgi:hypothetical protein
MLKHLFGYLVGSGGKNEVIKMQAFNSMRPPRDGGFAPLSHDNGVMTSLLCNIANALGKRQCAGKVTEFKTSRQLHDAIVLDNLPLAEAF